MKSAPKTLTPVAVRSMLTVNPFDSSTKAVDHSMVKFYVIIKIHGIFAYYCTFILLDENSMICVNSTVSTMMY